MNFGVEVVQARASASTAAPRASLPTWSPPRCRSQPGRHQVEMWIVWGLYQQAGLQRGRRRRAARGRAGELAVARAPPFAKGQFTIEAPGTEPYNLAPLPDRPARAGRRRQCRRRRRRLAPRPVRPPPAPLLGRHRLDPATCRTTASSVTDTDP